MRTKISPTFRQMASVHYRIQVLDKGVIVKETPLKRNLILNVGLDMIASRSWPQNIFAISVGSGTTPTKRDSGATTFSRSGNTVTANNTFFDPTDDDNGGRLLKFDSGEEMTVTGYVSATVVTVNVSGTLAASQGTLWYVNETQNQTEVMRFSGKSTGPGECQSSFTAGTWTHKVTFLSNSIGSAFTAREIGWAPLASLGTNLFGRDLIAGGGIGLAAGQQIKVTLFLTVDYSPTSGVSYGDVGNNGFNTAGQGTYEYIAGAMGTVDGSGNAGIGALDPSSGNGASGGTCLGMFTSPYTLGGMSNTNDPSLISSGYDFSDISYGAGNYYKDKIAGISLPTTTFYGFCVGGSGSSFGPFNIHHGYSYVFTTPQPTSGLNNLFFTLRWSWGRVLVN